MLGSKFWLACVAVCCLPACDTVHTAWYVVGADVSAVESFYPTDPDKEPPYRATDTRIVGDHGLPGDLYRLSAMNDWVGIFPPVIRARVLGTLHEWRRVDSFRGHPVGYRHANGGALCWIRSPSNPVELWVEALPGDDEYRRVVAEGQGESYSVELTPIVLLSVPLD
jgi:hypothetical protein